MKKLIFVILKLTEVSAVVFIPYYLGKFVHLWTGFLCTHNLQEPQCAPFWVIGFISMIFVLGAGLTGGLIIMLIRSNWELADKLHKKLSKGK